MSRCPHALPAAGGGESTRGRRQDLDDAPTDYLMAQAYRKLGQDKEAKAELETFQYLITQKASRAAKRPDPQALKELSGKERPSEEESLDGLN